MTENGTREMRAKEIMAYSRELNSTNRSSDEINRLITSLVQVHILV